MGQGDTKRVLQTKNWISPHVCINLRMCPPSLPPVRDQQRCRSSRVSPGGSGDLTSFNLSLVESMREEKEQQTH